MLDKNIFSPGICIWIFIVLSSTKNKLEDLFVLPSAENSVNTRNPIKNR